MRRGHIENVEMLRDGPDAELIEQAKRLFKEHNAEQRYDGFEIWSGRRFVYREPPN
jgi:antibiotic biosynthesis monooxygenase (ABM) superfamily enzyme